MKSGVSKKGISPLIATVLLIGFTVALVALVILWGRGFVTEKAQKEGILAETRLRCQSLSFDVTYLAQAGESIIARVKNTGAQNIEGFIFRMKGEEEVQPVETTDIIRKADSREIRSEAVGIGTVSSVEIIPRLRAGKGTYVPCSGQSKEARVKAAA